MSKRLFDFFVSFVSLLMLLPVLVFLALLVRINNGAPIFFCQTRPGLHCKEFTLIKFRTMANHRGADGALLPDAKRLTRLGRFMRSASLDELPELWNVLKGDMSLVGPRPLLTEYVSLYSPKQLRRHDVRPGITGWAQVNGRNSISWQDKFEYDVWYVENQSFLLDFKIILMTIKKVISREGISADGEATMARQNA